LNKSSRLWVALLLLALVLILGRNALFLVFELALTNPEYSHILLVLPIVLVFLYLEDGRDAFEGPSSPVLGAGFAIAGIVVWLVSRRVPTADGLDLTLRVSALVLAAWAVASLVYGWGFVRAALFPMAFLCLLVPLPTSAVTKLTLALQSGSTTAAYLLFKIFGVPVTRDGFVLSLRSMDIEVAKECSGIRSTVMLLVTALVLGQWYLRAPWRRTLLALAVFPVGILRNGLRIFVLSMLGTYVDEDWLEGNLHHRGGIAFFMAGLAMIVLLLWFLGRAERKGPRVARGEPRPESSGPGEA
jgi:exosortase